MQTKNAKDLKRGDTYLLTGREFRVVGRVVGSETPVTEIPVKTKGRSDTFTHYISSSRPLEIISKKAAQ